MLNQIFKIEISATTVAWYGAIVATISVAFSIILGLIAILRDRVKVKIKVSEGFVAHGTELDHELQIFIEAINTGRRTVTLSGTGFILKNGKRIVILDPVNIRFPYELKEGQSCQIYTDKKGLLNDVEKENSKITHAWYRDATGKVYKKRFKPREGVIEDEQKSGN